MRRAAWAAVAAAAVGGSGLFVAAIAAQRRVRIPATGIARGIDSGANARELAAEAFEPDFDISQAVGSFGRDEVHKIVDECLKHFRPAIGTKQKESLVGHIMECMPETREIWKGSDGDAASRIRLARFINHYLNSPLFKDAVGI
jgi:hypothetical protein